MTVTSASRRTLKGFRHGTHRVVKPGETLGRIGGLFGPMGITRVANVTGLDCIGIPVVAVYRPNARSLAVSQGKGLDLDSAKASGIMEAIEFWHAEHVTLPLKLASWNELRLSHDVAAVDALPTTTVSTFHENHPLLWVCGVDLVTGAPTWLPFEMVHANFTLPLPTGSGAFVMTSNGLASGNHFLEATSHALCEVIERDATVLFRLKDDARQEAVRVDLESIDDPHCKRLLSLYAAADVAVGVWDITSDIGIPAFYVVIFDRLPNVFRKLSPVHGVGCHPVREVALSRALTEAAQGRLTLIVGSRDDNGRAFYREAQEAELANRATERLSRRGTRAFQDAPSHVNHTFEADVKTLLVALREVGLEQALVVDLSKPEYGIPVVRVVVPGLESHPNVNGAVFGKRARRAHAARK